MIIFKNNTDKPIDLLQNFYEEARSKNQLSIDALLVASYSTKNNEVDSRYVNLKFIEKNKFIFFSNYESQKSIQFKEHPQVSCLLFWNAVNVQIRFKGKISKTSSNFNSDYFKTRSPKKNALSISSKQSRVTDSYQNVIENYKETLTKKNLDVCPTYWGGYSVTPYYFEFWEGKKNRVNKRISFFKKNKENWVSNFLEP